MPDDRLQVALQPPLNQCSRPLLRPSQFDLPNTFWCSSAVGCRARPRRRGQFRASCLESSQADRYCPRCCAGNHWLNHSRRWQRSEEHTSELQSLRHLVCRLLCPTCSTLFPYTTLFRSDHSFVLRSSTYLILFGVRRRWVVALVLGVGDSFAQAASSHPRQTAIARGAAPVTTG